MKIFFPVVLLILSFCIHANIINIPDDYSTIQDGINASADGDTVLVKPGIYTGSLNYYGKAITLGSLFLATNDSSYIDSTVINYSSNGDYVVNFTSGEDKNSILCGFTISGTNGIICKNSSSPQILNNIFLTQENWAIRAEDSQVIISDNIFDCTGGWLSYCPLWFVGGDPVITGNIIYGVRKLYTHGIVLIGCTTSIIANNHITKMDYGIKSEGSSVITNNLVANCCGVGVSCHPQAKLINNTIVNNDSYGVRISTYGGEVTNCIIWGNEFCFNPDYSPVLENNCLEGYIPLGAVNNGGNIFSDPCFTDSVDYQLQIVSPCIESGTADTTSLNLTEYDLDDNLRIQDGNGDGLSVIDIGCYESNIVTNPGFISGNITLVNGTGNVEDVNVGIGTPVHPDANGDYTLAFSPEQSPYNVTASLNDYMSQTLQNVEVLPGGTTENIDFTLYYHLPDFYLEFSVDTLFFLTEFQFQQDFIIKNISGRDINITNIDRGSAPVIYQPYDLPFPQRLAPENSLEITMALMRPTKPSAKEIQNDSIFIHTDMGSYVIPVIYDDIYLNAIEEDYIQVSDFQLNNYPNPFNPSTIISFMLKSDSNIELSVYNLKGELVRTIAKGLYKSGYHNLKWYGKDSDQRTVTSGIYILKLYVDDKVGAVKNCILLK